VTYPPYFLLILSTILTYLYNYYLIITMIVELVQQLIFNINTIS
jgi:hypothetical protein